MIKRTYPIGSEIIPKKGTHFRVWAPDHKKVELILENSAPEPIFIPMKAEKGGYFSLLAEEAKEGTHYRFRLSGKEKWHPDPASRYQPKGPGGPSCVMSRSYPWKDKNWYGLKAKGQIVYEIHIGTFTEAGNFQAAIKELPRLADLGITMIELMPINEFPGHFGWGYDGVNLFAPTHLYGKPEDVKAFIDQAHELGIGIVLDVVYNHFGPEENHMFEFAKAYASETNKTDWGQAINFDLPQTKEFFLTNVRYWIEEFHFDGLRFDATPLIFSCSPVHILAEMTKAIKEAGGKREVLSIAENEPQDTNYIRSYEEGGYGFDMMWNDDFHHTALVRLTGNREAYYNDYLGNPQEFISSLKYGFLFQGQYYAWQKKNRGKMHLKASPESFIIFLENHDQIGNSGHGARLHKRADPGNYKAMTALFLLSPNTPLLFQGQEFNSNPPFYYFSDHLPELSSLIKKGRVDELSQFPRLATSEMRRLIPDPDNPLTFIRSKLKNEDLKNNEKAYLFFKDLITLRKTDPVFKKMQDIEIDGAVLGSDSFLVRYFGEDDGDRLLIINFGPDFIMNPAPEPLLAAGLDLELEILWSSESLIYGGGGTPSINVPYWKLIGHSAVVFKTKPKRSS